MKQLLFSRIFSILMSFGLLISPLPMSAITQEVVKISELEADILTQNPDGFYVYLGKELSNIGDIIEKIIDWDGDKDSPLHELKNHLDSGFFLAQHDAVVQALEHAELVIERNNNTLNNTERKQLINDFQYLASQVVDGSLSIDSKDLQPTDNRQTHSSFEIVRRKECGSGLRTLVVNENLEVLGKTTLKKHLHTKQGAHIEGKLKVCKDATFKKNVKIKGTLSAADAFIETLSVEDAHINNLSVTDLVVLSCIDNLCVNSLSVNDLAVASCMDSLCVNTLSAVDATISGVLTVNDAVIQDLTVITTVSVLDSIINMLTVFGTLSATDAVITNLEVTNMSVADAVIGNLSVTDLVVTNCIADLCVNDLSIVDASITGTLSVNDAIVTNITTTSLSATDAVISNLSVTDLFVANCIADLCVSDLSIVDVSVSGTLSVNDAVVTNITVTNLSATDAVISNLSVTDLVVTNCIADLCVNDLSIVDMSVSGTLSVNDEVLSGSLTLTALTPAGILHNNASGLLSSSLIVNADVAAGAAIVDTKLATISTAGKVANSATTATSANTINTIVLRDGSGNFSAGTITASLNGNATTATTATNFSGLLAGEVTGPQGATVVSNAVSANTPNAIVRRTASGGFSAGAISVTDEVVSSSLTITPFGTAGIVHNNASGLLSSSLIVNADVAVGAAIVDTKLATISTAGKVANSATTATSANTINTIVLRDGSGNFSAGTITASLNGNATTATTATNFSGLLAGEVTGPQGATVVSNAVSANTPNAIVRRTASGGFSAGAISVTDEVVSSSLTITPFGTAGIVHNNASGLLSSSLIVNADVAAGAAIVDTKLATISTALKVSNSATTATSANTANAIVARSGTNGFSAGAISITDGIASGNLVLTANPSTSTTGNIVKGANRFIHNFGTNNTFIGELSGNFTVTGTDNTALGYNAMNAVTTGSSNTALGSGALEDNTIGISNTAVGSGALGNNTTGNNNIGVGTNALNMNTTGILNVATGFISLGASTTGNQNTAYGTNTLEQLITGSGNIALGAFAGQNASGASSNNIYIDNIGAPESDTTRIGDAQTRCFVAGIRGVTTDIVDAIPVLIDSAGQLGTISSSKRFKHDIQDMNADSANLLNLRPVTFAYNSDESNTKQFGLIAEEVDELLPEIVVHDEDGAPYTVQYHILPVLLVNEMKKQHATIEKMNDVIDNLQAQMQEFIERIKIIESKA